MFLDILYTLQQFVAPLPEDYDEFKVNFLFLNLGAKNSTYSLNRGWCIKFATRLLFCQNDFPMGGSFLQKDSLTTHTQVCFLNYAYYDIQPSCKFDAPPSSSKMAPMILFFSLFLGAEYSFYVKSIATYALQKVDMIIHFQAVCSN